MVVNHGTEKKILCVLTRGLDIPNNLRIWMFPKIGGKPPKWMVKIMEKPMNKWMIWGYTYFWKHPYDWMPRVSNENTFTLDIQSPSSSHTFHVSFGVSEFGSLKKAFRLRRCEGGFKHLLKRCLDV